MTTADASKPSPDRYLGIYLNDHRAGATAGLALAKRVLRENEGTPLGDTLQSVLGEIEEEAATLDRIAHALGVRADPIKVSLARAGEVVSRLKPNGQLRGYSPLSRLLEVEALLSAIDAKRSLWLSLGAARHPKLSDHDFDALARRSGDQRDRLAPHHDLAAQMAFGSVHPVGSAAAGG